MLVSTMAPLSLSTALNAVLLVSPHYTIHATLNNKRANNALIANDEKSIERISPKLLISSARQTLISLHSPKLSKHGKPKVASLSILTFLKLQ